MLFGTASFAETPFASLTTDGNVTIIATGNNLVASIGNPNITADAITENVTGNPLTLGIGTVTIVGTANLEAPKTPLTLGTGNVTVSADANVAASGNNLIISSGSVSIVGTASIEAPATAMTLGTGEVGVITWNEIIPGATMVWTPIKPY
jgi:hypothetical protein